MLSKRGKIRHVRIEEMREDNKSEGRGDKRRIEKRERGGRRERREREEIQI